MKVDTPYIDPMPVKTASEIVNSALSAASGKIKARYPHEPLGTNVTDGCCGGKMKHKSVSGTGAGPSGS